MPSVRREKEERTQYIAKFFYLCSPKIIIDEEDSCPETHFAYNTQTVQDARKRPKMSLHTETYPKENIFLRISVHKIVCFL